MVDSRYALFDESGQSELQGESDIGLSIRGGFQRMVRGCTLSKVSKPTECAEKMEQLTDFLHFGSEHYGIQEVLLL